MSTPLTGRDERPRRLRPRRGRPADDRARRGRPDPRLFPDGSLPQPEPIEPALIRGKDTEWLRRGAREHGARAAKAGVYDPWVLSGPEPVPYFAELASARDRVRQQLTVEAARAEESAALEAGRVRAALTAAEARLRRADDRRTLLESQRDRATAQLDRLAQRADRWHAFRDRVVGRFDPRGTRAGLPPDRDDPEPRPGDDREPAAGHPRWYALSDTPPTAPADTPDPLPAPAADPAARAAWEGATARPGMPVWGRLALLALLALVEIPVYYAVFTELHGTGDTAAGLTVSLTLAVSTVMILGPHFAGRILRRRSATGAIRLAALPALAALVAWGYGAWTLGDMRARLVFREEPPLQLSPDVEPIPQVSLIDSLNLSPDTVSLMFVALLLLSGGVALLLGLGDEHPHLGSYRSAVEALRALDERIEEEQAGAERARQAEAALDIRTAARRNAHDARLDAVGHLYEAAAQAYLDGLSGASSDPAVTEAAMRLSRRRPLLPA
ncbi:hypothetical protein [Streptomyces sp. NPDC001889]